MPRTLHVPTESLTATLGLGGRELPFRLYTRPLRLGPFGTVQYYWMDSSQFRITRKRRALDPANFRNCISHWWLAMRSMGLGGDPTQIGHRILATSYALVSSSKALQNVYRDAHLIPNSTKPTEDSLPDPIRRRIRAAVEGRDTDRVRRELDESLGRAHFPAEERTAMRQTFDGILQHGVDLVRRNGDDGLEEFLGCFDAWCATRRKKCPGWLRHFLDLFSYECKISFYRCYANVWIDLIPWLRENVALDEAGERFLRIWHMQNQPIEPRDGRVIPDVFRGQVLSLHPLSGFLMKDPASCAVAGRFILSDAYDRVMVGGRAEDCAEYWDFVGAILTAAALYRQALDRQGERRGVRQRTSDDPDLAKVTDATRSDTGLLEEFAAGLGLRCPRCGGALRSRGFDPVDPEDDGFVAEFTCPGCDLEARHRFARRDLEVWLHARP